MFCIWEFGIQIMFQFFSGGQFVQEVFFFVSVKGCMIGFDVLLDLVFFFGVGDVYIFSVNWVIVGLFECVEQFVQFYCFFVVGKGVDIEGFLEIGFG